MSSTQHRYRSDLIAELAAAVAVQKLPLESYGDQILAQEWTHCPKQLINALRRAIIADVPTMRIDSCFAHSDTNCDFDPFTTELRVGMIPIRANADEFLFETEILPEEEQPPSWKPRFESDRNVLEKLGHGIAGRPNYLPISTFVAGASNEIQEILKTIDPRTTLVFELKAECTFNEETQQLESEVVRGSDLKWIPIGEQQANVVVKPTPHPDVVISELTWGQRMHRILFCVKGTGFEHAKWRGADAHFKLLAENRYKFIVKSKDGAEAQKYLKDACSILSQRYTQLARDCQ